jgi:hypothetical protein
MALQQQILKMAQAAKKISYELAVLPSLEKDAALKLMADELRSRQDYLIKENKKDIKGAEVAKLNKALIDRLVLDEKRIARPIATPMASAPITVGTGFSRRKNSVRSRATLARSFVCSQASPAICETLSAACRNRPCSSEPRSSPDLIEAASGSSSVYSSPLGLII